MQRSGKLKLYVLVENHVAVHSI